MKKTNSMIAEGEGLRRAAAWLADQVIRDAGAIEEASRRFNLSPLEAQFLLDHFRAPRQDAR